MTSEAIEMLLSQNNEYLQYLIGSADSIKSLLYVLNFGLLGTLFIFIMYRFLKIFL